MKVDYSVVDVVVERGKEGQGGGESLWREFWRFTVCKPLASVAEIEILKISESVS